MSLLIKVYPDCLLLQKNAVEILAQEMVTDLPSSFGKSFIDLSGFSMAKRAAAKCFSRSGLSPTDVDVLEVHDCFSCNEVRLHFAPLNSKVYIRQLHAYFMCDPA